MTSVSHLTNIGWGSPESMTVEEIEEWSPNLEIATRMWHGNIGASSCVDWGLDCQPNILQKSIMPGILSLTFGTGSWAGWCRGGCVTANQRLVSVVRREKSRICRTPETTISKYVRLVFHPWLVRL